MFGSGVHLSFLSSSLLPISHQVPITHTYSMVNLLCFLILVLTLSKIKVFTDVNSLWLRSDSIDDKSHR